MTDNGFDALCGILAAAYPAHPFGAATQAMYRHSLLDDFEDEEMSEAAEAWIERERFFPTIADLRKETERNKPRRHDQSWNAHKKLPAWTQAPDHSHASIAELDRLGILGPDGKTRGFPNRAYYEGMQMARERMDEMLAENARKRAAHRSVQSNPPDPETKGWR